MNRHALELGVAAMLAVGALVITTGSGSAPDRPWDATARPGNGSAAVTWNAPSGEGTHITTYTVTVSPGGQTVTVNGDRTGANVHGLRNGVTYAFTIHADNAFGESAGSSPTRQVTPEGEPPAPTDVHATAGIGRAVVSWQRSPDDGEYPIAAYTVTASGGQHAMVAGTETHATVSGLDNGARYTFEVNATTRMGTSAASVPSALVMTRPGVPSAPLYPDAFAGDRSIELLWQPPAQDGGSAIASYTVTTTPAGEHVTIPARRGVLPTVTIHRLTNGTRYRFTVYATNAFGHSAKSVPSNIVAPFGPPGAPTRVHATEQAGHVSVSWTAPTSDNGSAINEYRVTAIPGGMLAGVDAPHHSLTLGSLTRGGAYTFTVVALNDAANGQASSPSNVLVVGDPARAASNPTT